MFKIKREKRNITKESKGREERESTSLYIPFLYTEGEFDRGSCPSQFPKRCPSRRKGSADAQKVPMASPVLSDDHRTSDALLRPTCESASPLPLLRETGASLPRF